MPIAQDRLEQLQVLKLLQSVRNEDVEQIEKLTTHGVPYVINYSGKVYKKKLLNTCLYMVVFSCLSTTVISHHSQGAYFARGDKLVVDLYMARNFINDG